MFPDPYGVAGWLTFAGLVGFLFLNVVVVFLAPLAAGADPAPRPQPRPATLATKLRPVPDLSVKHQFDQPSNVVMMHSSNSGWHCVCNDTHATHECWCADTRRVPVVLGN